MLYKETSFFLKLQYSSKYIYKSYQKESENCIFKYYCSIISEKVKPGFMKIRRRLSLSGFKDFPSAHLQLWSFGKPVCFIVFVPVDMSKRNMSKG